MKRLLSVALIFVMILSLCACGKPSGTDVLKDQAKDDVSGYLLSNYIMGSDNLKSVKEVNVTKYSINPNHNVTYDGPEEGVTIEAYDVYGTYIVLDNFNTEYTGTFTALYYLVGYKGDYQAEKIELTVE